MKSTLEIRRWRAPLRALLFTTTAIAGFCAVAPAIAADIKPANDDSLEEVVITSQKRTEKLSDTTVSASVLSSESLDNGGVSDISDISKMVPAVSLAGTFNGRVPLAVRGVESQSNEAAVGVASGVGIEIDGVPVPSDSFAANEVEDIVNIEVLEGPQATLGGRTATSGVINYITHKPTNIWTGSTTDTFTTDGERHITGTLSGPITDRVGVSVSAWDHYTQFPVKNLTLDQNSSDDSYGVRDKIKIAVTDDFDATLMTRLSANRSNGFNFAYSYVYPGTYILAGPGGGPPFWSQAALFPSSIHINANNTDYASPMTQASEIRYDADASLNLEYRIGEYTLTSTTAYQHETRRSIQDLFAVNEYFGDVAQAALGIPFAFGNIQSQYVNSGQTTEEIKLASPANDRFNYVAGLFYSDDRTQLHEIRPFFPALLNSVITPDTSTYDAYFHGNFKLLENTTLTGGVRFNHDALKYTIDQLAYNPGTGPISPIYSAGSSDSNAIVGDIGVKQQITPEADVYFTYTRGYAPEVYNTAYYLTTPGTLQPVSQEHINSFELGSKGRYFDGKVLFNASLFDTVYQNYQIQTYIPVPGAAAGILDLTSAGEAETRGAEFSSQIRPWAGGHISFDGAYTFAVFNKYEGGPCYFAATEASLYPSSCYYDATQNTWRANLSGKTMPNAPKLKAHLSFEQSYDLEGFIPYTAQVGFDASYRSRAQMQADQNPYTIEDAYGILNLHATLLDNNGYYSVTVFCNNVTDTHYSVDVEDFWASPWGSNAVVRQPARDTNRYGGVRLNAQF
jgi:iron complex outermembrane receptor protein